MTLIKINVKTFVCFVLIICGFESFSQDDISLESYRHGEGIRFSQDDSYSFRIRGWLQPWYQSTKYLGDNEIGYAKSF